MENNERLEMFKFELSLIKDDIIKEFTELALCELPDYFFSIPASSTGKYHPSYALGEGGLVRHSKAAVRIFCELVNINFFSLSSEETDLCISALILHDGMKNGSDPTNKYTVTKHPILVSDLLKEKFERDFVPKICSLIETHMGQWTRDFKTKEVVLEEPKTKMQRLVHIADYLASRKNLELNFDAGITAWKL